MVLSFRLTIPWITLSETILQQVQKVKIWSSAAVIDTPAWTLLNLLMFICQIYFQKILLKFFDLLKYDTNADSTAFLESVYTNFFLPYITTPTQATTHSKTLIDNIFSSNIEDGLKSGNMISTISDHFTQFLLQKNIKIDKSKSNLFQHNFKSDLTWFWTKTDRLEHNFWNRSKRNWYIF